MRGCWCVFFEKYFEEFFTVGGLFTSFGAVPYFLSSAHFVILLVRKKIKKSDHMAMVPYFAFAASAYIVFFWGEWEFLAL